MRCAPARALLPAQEVAGVMAGSRRYAPGVTGPSAVLGWAAGTRPGRGPGSTASQ